MSSKLIIANFKSNKNPEEFEHWIEMFEKQSKRIPSTIQVVLAPSFPSLSLVSNRLLDRKTYPQVHLGIQDISPFPAGSYTGAVGTHNVDGLHVEYAIVGHSERRAYFHETDVDVANKVREARASTIIPIVCVTKSTISTQANAIESADRSKVIVAFEPIDHIGTGIADSIEDILEARKLVKEAFGDIPFVYGGSVDSKTDPTLLQHEDIDGFLLGGASLDARAFCELIGLIQ